MKRPFDMSRKPERKPRWRTPRFGGGLECLVGQKWIGSVGPEIGGTYRYNGWHCFGEAPTLDEAKAAVEASIAMRDRADA